MHRVSTSPDDFLAEQPDGVAADMVRLDALITSSMPGRARVLWEGVFWGGTQQRIIGYGDLVQPRPRGDDVEWFVVGLARQKSGISVYVNAVAQGRYLLADYTGRLGTARTGSASIGFRRADDLDLDAFTDLVRRAHELCPPDPG